MWEIITDYFIKITFIPGGVQVNLGYAMVVILFWSSWALFKRLRRR
jgi:hypothetical protein